MIPARLEEKTAHIKTPLTCHVTFFIYLLIFSRISFLQHEEEGGAKYYPELTDLTQISSSIKLCRRVFLPSRTKSRNYQEIARFSRKLGFGSDVAAAARMTAGRQQQQQQLCFKIIIFLKAHLLLSC